MHKYLGLPELASEHGKQMDDLMLYIHWLMLVLFVGWLIYFFYALVRFRRARQPKADPVGVRSHVSNYLEVAVAVIEAVLLIGFSVPLWAKVVDKLPADKDATVVRVIAQQFAWNIVYPGKDGEFGHQDMKLVAETNPLGFDAKDPKTKDNLVLLNEMHVPVNKPVIVHLSSKDVIHSFKLPAQRVCQDVIPGMRIPTWFVPTKVGKFQINCAQLCGNGHYGMTAGLLVVEPQADYDKWFAEKTRAIAATATSFE